MNWLIVLFMFIAVPAWAQDRPVRQQQLPGDAHEQDAVAHWQAVDLAHKNLANSMARLIEDRRRLQQELEGLKAARVSEAPK